MRPPVSQPPAPRPAPWEQGGARSRGQRIADRALVTLEALQQGAPGAPEPPPAVDAQEDDADVEPARAIRCAACRHPVTTERERVEVHGAHEHRRVNPSGLDFHVGCFARAPGCAAQGEPTQHWTWFPGYAWRIALCACCGAHLGWAFSGAGTFHGLILARLLRDAD